MLSHFSHVLFFATLWTIAHQAPLSMEFPRQEYWSALPFPSPGDLPDPGINPTSPSLQADSLSAEPSECLAYSLHPVHTGWMSVWRPIKGLQAHQGAAILNWTSCCSCDHSRGDNPGPEGESHQCHRNPVWRGLFRGRVIGWGALPALHQPYLPGILCKPCPPPLTTLPLCLATSILSLTWILPFPSCCFFFSP